MQDSPLQSLLEAEKIIFNFTGIYKGNDREKDILKKLRQFIFLGFSWLLEISLIILVILELKDLSAIIGPLMLLIQQTAFVSKLFIFLSNERQILMLEAKLENFAMHEFVVSDKIIMQKDLKQISILGQAYRLSCVLCCIIFTVGPFVNKHYKEYEFPLPGYIPYVVNSKFKYAITCVCQMFSFYIAGGLNSSLDIFCCKLMEVASSLFQILDRQLNTIGRSDIQNQGEHFKKCVSFHNDILKYIKMVEDVYSYIVFSQFAASAIVICTTAFEIASLPISTGELIASLMYLLNMIIEVGLYCFYGHHIQTMSDGLCSACYKSQWYKTELTVKTMVIIFMENNKKPLTLRAGKMVPLHLTTLTMILRTSYSYFAVLNQVYQNNNY
uniref:Odorant receptor n=1 Tax=Eucryptorrhynchus scrobiculatus TaxID=1552824 RepID=A0A8F4RRA5_EUCSC|nr:odorant receptor 2 [Eucryptorrhynchus scrobiculatus]